MAKVVLGEFDLDQQCNGSPLKRDAAEDDVDLCSMWSSGSRLVQAVELIFEFELG